MDCITIRCKICKGYEPLNNFPNFEAYLENLIQTLCAAATAAAIRTHFDCPLVGASLPQTLTPILSPTIVDIENGAGSINLVTKGYTPQSEIETLRLLSSNKEAKKTGSDSS